MSFGKNEMNINDVFDAIEIYSLRPKNIYFA